MYPLAPALSDVQTCASLHVNLIHDSLNFTKQIRQENPFTLPKDSLQWKAIQHKISLNIGFFKEFQMSVHLQKFDTYNFFIVSNNMYV